MYRPALLLALVLMGVGLLSGQTPAPATAIKPLLLLDREGHTDIVRHVLFSPKAEQLITVSLDKTVRVWDLESGTNTKTFRFPGGPGLEGSLTAAALAPDGRSVAVAGVPVQVATPNPVGFSKLPVPKAAYIYLVWTQTGQLMRTIKLQDAPAVVSPLNPKIDVKAATAAASADKTVYAVAYSRDGTKLAAALADKTARIVELKTGKVVQTLKGHTGPVLQVAFSPDGKKVVTAGDTNGRIWSVATGKSEATLTASKSLMVAAAWSPDGKTVATGNADGTITLWEPNGKLRQTIDDLGSIPTSMTFTPESNEILCTVGNPTKTGAAPEYSARLLDLATGKEKLRFKEHTDRVTAGSVARDGTLAASVGGKNNQIYIWKTADAATVKTLIGKGQTPQAVAWTADGKGFLFAPNAEALAKQKFFDLEELAFATETKSFQGGLTMQEDWTLAKDDKGKLIVKEKDKVVHTIDLGKDKEEIVSHTWVRNGRAVVAGRRTMYVIDPKANRVVRTFTAHLRENYSVAANPDGRLFLSAGADHVIRLWDPDREEPLLSFFFTENEWIAWTPDGYYAASTDGERMLGWWTTRTPDTLPTYAPITRYRQALCLPEVIKLIVPTGSVAKALLQAGKKPTSLAAVTAALPPQIAITGPAPPEDGGPIKVEENTKLEIAATAKSLSGQTITAMRLMIDGRPYKGASGVQQLAPPRIGPVTLTWKVELPPGTHTVAAVAQTGNSRSMSPWVELNCGGQDPTPPGLYVLAVGINDYEGSMRLKFAAPDAEVIARTLKARSTKLFGKIETKTILDKDATKQEILAGLKWLASVMTPRDTAVVSFSGHGGCDKAGKQFLVPVDYNPRSPFTSSLAGDQFKNALGELPGRVICILDACHSGAVTLSGGSTRLRTMMEDLVRDLISDDYGVIVLCSSLGSEVSLESAAVKHGFFTAAIVEGLSGRADFNSDGLIHLNELEGYAARRVKELSADKQHPIFAKPAHVKWFPLATSEKK